MTKALTYQKFLPCQLEQVFRHILHVEAEQKEARR